MAESLKSKSRKPRKSAAPEPASSVRQFVECLEDRCGATGVGALETIAVVGVGCAAVAATLATVHQNDRAETAAATHPAPTEQVALTEPAHESPWSGEAVSEVFLRPDVYDAPDSDAALLHAYRQEQSDAAFATLVERHRDSIYRTCYRLLGSSQDAEDVTQMVFLVLAQHQLRMNTPSLAPWLRTVARNAAIGVLRSRRRRNYHERAAAQPARECTQETSNELREEIEAALAQMPPALGEAVRLRYLEGWSQKEAARIAGCPRGTVSQRAANGLRQLRSILSPEVIPTRE
jgi:RNA polymerase sigma-70 factor (ECF subfamily)